MSGLKKAHLPTFVKAQVFGVLQQFGLVEEQVYRSA